MFTDCISQVCVLLCTFNPVWPLSVLDHSVAAKSGGCFPGETLVTLEHSGQKPIREVQPGERVLASSGSNGGGELLFSEVLTFLDHDPGTWKLFYALQTESGLQLSLTAAHLLFVSQQNCSEGAAPALDTLSTVYASDAHPGLCLLVSMDKLGNRLREGRLSRITQVRVREARGVFAPLTEHGTLVVDGVVASCYAVVDQHSLAHWAFFPLRLIYSWTGTTGYNSNGIHWYSQLLHWLGHMLLASERLHPLGVAQDERWDRSS